MSSVGRQQGPNYSGGVMGTIMSFIPAGDPPPPKDNYQILKDDFRRVQNELENYKCELRRCHGEIRSANHYIQELHHEKQGWKDRMGGLRQELTSAYQQLEHAKTLSEVLGRELFGLQVSSTRVDTLSISKVSDKVTALNEDNLQATATLGEALVHQPHQDAPDGAAAKSQKTVGETAAEGTGLGRNIASCPTGRPLSAQLFLGHLPEDEQQETSEIGRQQGSMGTIMSFIPAGGPPPPKDKYQILKDDFRRVQNELENYKRELRRCHGEIRSANHYIQELHHEKQGWKDHMGGLQYKLTSVHQQLEDAKALSKARGEKLFGAQVFSTKPDDTLSVSEVGEKVTALNEEIFQTAAALGEAIVHRYHDLPQEDFDVAAAESQEMVGDKISSLLINQAQKPGHGVNPLLVQVVLQVLMISFCVSKIRSWYPRDSAVGEILNAIYSEICLTEEQTVSGRWRALTRAHTRPTTETWTNELSKKLMSVLKIAAWNPGSLENQESFRQRLPLIFKAVTELRIAIGENFTSADLDVSVFDCGTIYEPSHMEDAYGDGSRQPSGKQAPEIVVGTTGIGLKKLMAERSANDALQFQHLIPAKIVLESTLKEALEPVQSSGGRVRKNRKKPVERADRADYDDRAYQDGRD